MKSGGIFSDRSGTLYLSERPSGVPSDIDGVCWRARLSSFERTGPGRFFDSGDEAAVRRGGGLEGL